MQKSQEAGLKSSIVKGLKKAPDKLLAELSKQCPPDSDKAWLKTQLDVIAGLLETEAAKQEERKTLSRKIGPAKKNNEDCSALITSVSQLSTRIDELNDQIKNQVLDIQSAMENADDSENHTGPTTPQHLIPATQSGDANDLESLPAGFTVSDEVLTDLSEWQTFVDQTAHATIYHDGRWKEIIKNNFGHDLHHITYRDPTGSLAGVLPLCHLKSQVFGSFSISMPYFNYGGPLAESPAIEEALLSHAASLSDKLGCSHMEIRETKGRSTWKSVQRKVSMILPLPSSDEKLDAELGSKIRAQVNKAKSNDLSVKFGGLDLLDHYYQVFSRNMRDLGTPVYGKKIFGDILECFPDSAFIAIVYKDGQPLAAGFLLGYRDKLEIPWASSIRSQNHLGANMFMYRSILTEAISRKYEFFDFGRSTIDASTYKFKKQWGAKEHPLHWHYWTRDNNDVPSINPDNPKYKLVIRAWQMLPVFVTRIIGPKIARNLP